MAALATTLIIYKLTLPLRIEASLKIMPYVVEYFGNNEKMNNLN